MCPSPVCLLLLPCLPHSPSSLFLTRHDGPMRLLTELVQLRAFFGVPATHHHFTTSTTIYRLPYANHAYYAYVVRPAPPISHSYHY
ncbi:hypothetical protein GGR56DRAFT_629019 [Xylariaceae sp. FL0804]|nr:hypothetical protein GGR56DRAFT_629019 [Xylariaceae sp. FL0804]